MSASRESQKKCAACGKLIDRDVLICPYCDDRRELELQLARTRDIPELQTAACETDATIQLNAQVSNAINIRRMTLVVILAVVVSVGTTLVGLIHAVFVTDQSKYLELLKTWVAFAVLIMMVGVCVIIFNKRLTRPGGPAFLRPE